MDRSMDTKDHRGLIRDHGDHTALLRNSPLQGNQGAPPAAAHAHLNHPGASGRTTTLRAALAGRARSRPGRTATTNLSGARRHERDDQPEEPHAHLGPRPEFRSS